MQTTAVEVMYRFTNC